jgi:hypothetical protein
MVDFKASFFSSIQRNMTDKVLSTSNSFLKAAFFHPGVAAFLRKSLDSTIFEEVIYDIEVEMGDSSLV